MARTVADKERTTMVVSSRSITTAEYLRMPESTRREELEFGWVVREPSPDPFWHQGQVMWLSRLLFDHVEVSNIGRVLPGNADVVLDAEKHLVVVPDILVLLRDRCHLVGKQIWGPPNLVIEVASPGTHRRDRLRKVEWYRTYGVQECWLIDTRKKTIHVFHLDDASMPDGRIMQGDEMVESRVLPDFRHSASTLLDPRLDDPWLGQRYDKDRP